MIQLGIQDVPGEYRMFQENTECSRGIQDVRGRIIGCFRKIQGVQEKKGVKRELQGVSPL